MHSYITRAPLQVWTEMHASSVSDKSVFDRFFSFLFLPAAAGFVHEAPLHAGGEARSSSASKPRDFHLVQDPVGSLQDDLLSLIPVSSFE